MMQSHQESTYQKQIRDGLAAIEAQARKHLSAMVQEAYHTEGGVIADRVVGAVGTWQRLYPGEGEKIQALVLTQKPIVFSIFGRHHGMMEQLGLDRETVEHECTPALEVWLWAAMALYREDSGNAFSTFAYSVLGNALKRMLQKLAQDKTASLFSEADATGSLFPDVRLPALDQMLLVEEQKGFLKLLLNVGPVSDVPARALRLRYGIRAIPLNAEGSAAADLDTDEALGPKEIGSLLDVSPQMIQIYMNEGNPRLKPFLDAPSLYWRAAFAVSKDEIVAQSFVIYLFALRDVPVTKRDIPARKVLPPLVESFRKLLRRPEELESLPPLSLQFGKLCTLNDRFKHTKPGPRIAAILSERGYSPKVIGDALAVDPAWICNAKKAAGVHPEWAVVARNNTISGLATLVQRYPAPPSLLNSHPDIPQAELTEHYEKLEPLQRVSLHAFCAAVEAGKSMVSVGDVCGILARLHPDFTWNPRSVETALAAAVKNDRLAAWRATYKSTKSQLTEKVVKFNKAASNAGAQTLPPGFVPPAWYTLDQYTERFRNLSPLQRQVLTCLSATGDTKDSTAVARVLADEYGITFTGEEIERIVKSALQELNNRPSQGTLGKTKRYLAETRDTEAELPTCDGLVYADREAARRIFEGEDSNVRLTDLERLAFTHFARLFPKLYGANGLEQGYVKTLTNDIRRDHPATKWVRGSINQALLEAWNKLGVRIERIRSVTQSAATPES